VPGIYLGPEDSDNTENVSSSDDRNINKKDKENEDFIGCLPAQFRFLEPEGYEKVKPLHTTFTLCIMYIYVIAYLYI
jgi:hypothetical protein